YRVSCGESRNNHSDKRQATSHKAETGVHSRRERDLRPRLQSAFVCRLLSIACMGLVAVMTGRGASTSSLQSTVSEAMRGRSGALVAIDIASGRVLVAEHLDVAARRLVYPGSA